MFELDCKKETERIVNKIKNTFKEKGFQKAIIGISGGLDSAVIASLCVKALGQSNVIGLMLPYGVQKDIEDSKLLVNSLGIFCMTRNIKPIVDMVPIVINGGVKRDTKKSNEPLSKLRLGNLMARVRMIVLFDCSTFYNGLVVGTGNRTELMLGYFTLHGDGACALEPIGHLYKTEVRMLAKYLNIPKIIITKHPSAGLWDGQTDEGELGWKYKHIDDLLHLIYDEKIDCKKLSCLPYGYTEKFMNDIMNKVSKNTFKTKGSIIFKR